MENETLYRDKPVWTAIWSLVIPSVLTILVMVVYNLADMFFIAMLGDDTQVAAVAVVGPVFSVANAVATTIGAGGCTLIARALGAGEREKASSLASLCVWTALGFGLVFAALLLLFSTPALHILGATEDLLTYSVRYLRILAIGSPLMLFSVSTASTVRAEGVIIPGMMSHMAGTVTNLVLDPLFILALHMGVSGAALATVIGNLAASLLLVRSIRGKCAVVRLSPACARGMLPRLPSVLATGLPNGASSILSGLASTFSNRLLHSYGSGAIAAMAAAGRSVMVITMVQMGICMGVSPLLSYAYGAKARDRLRETLGKTALLSFSFGLLSAVGCFFGRGALLKLFLQDPTNLALGGSLMIWLIAVSPLLGFYYLSSNFLQATGHAFQATLASVLRQGLLLIPLLYLLHAWMGLTGIAAAHTAADALSVVAAVCMAFRAYKETRLFCEL